MTALWRERPPSCVERGEHAGDRRNASPDGLAPPRAPDALPARAPPGHQRPRARPLFGLGECSTGRASPSSTLSSPRFGAPIMFSAVTREPRRGHRTGCFSDSAAGSRWRFLSPVAPARGGTRRGEETPWIVGLRLVMSAGVAGALLLVRAARMRPFSPRPHTRPRLLPPSRGCGGALDRVQAYAMGYGRTLVGPPREARRALRAGGGGTGYAGGLVLARRLS